LVQVEAQPVPEFLTGFLQIDSGVVEVAADIVGNDFRLFPGQLAEFMGPLTGVLHGVFQGRTGPLLELLHVFPGPLQHAVVGADVFLVVFTHGLVAP
jgi:hypothetical protein